MTSSTHAHLQISNKILKQYLGVGEWKSINVSISGIQQLDEAESSYLENMYMLCKTVLMNIKWRVLMMG
jgi:hypothetical protein